MVERPLGAGGEEPLSLRVTVHRYEPPTAGTLAETFNITALCPTSVPWLGLMAQYAAPLPERLARHFRVLLATVLFTTTTWAAGAAPWATAAMYRLLGDTLKAGAFAACMPGGRNITAMSMRGTELRDKEIINSFNYRAAREHLEPLSIRRWPEPCKYLIGQKSALL